MGQLEKYGLYVLCLVIFLILGVTIWGEPDGVRPDNVNPAAAMNASLGQLDPRVSPRSGANAAAVGLNGDLNGGSPNVVDANFRKDSGNNSGGGKPSLSSLLGPGANFGGASNPGGGNPGGGKPAVTESGGQPKPAVTEEPKPAPAESAATREYKIKKNDTLEGIAIHELGSRSRLAELLALNPNVRADKLQIGQVIQLPGKSGGSTTKSAANTAATPPTTGGDALDRAGAFRDYKISKGDTLDRIARVELGSSGRVEDIKKLNPGLDPRTLQIGKKIRLPLR